MQVALKLCRIQQGGQIEGNSVLLMGIEMVFLIGVYEGMEDLLCLDRCWPQSNGETLPVAMNGIVTPLHWEVWDHYLTIYPDPRLRRYLVQGIKTGFRIGFDYSRSCHQASRNMSLATTQPAVVRDYLSIECAAGRVLGPFPSDFLPNVHISRFGVIPKKSPGKWRLIIDLSSPEGFSVNDCVYERYCSMRYVSVDDAVRLVLAKGPGALMAKIYIKSAYRNIPIHPDDRWLLGMVWDGGIFVDAALPFGLRSAPKIFTAVADAAEWIARSVGVRDVLHYPDDFFLVGPSSSDECRADMHSLLQMFHSLGLPLAPDKLEGPTTCLSFLGLEIDTVAMELRLPTTKLTALQALIQSWLRRRSCTRRELESLIGSLRFACSVVHTGKTFLRRLFELLAVARKKHFYIRLNESFRSDLMWWSLFLAPLNHSPLMRSLIPDSQRVWFSSDASGSIGCGALWAPYWMQLKWFDTNEIRLEQDSITFKELLPIVLASALWGRSWKNQSVVVQCDNQGAVAGVNSGYSKVVRIMHLLRCLFFIRARFQFSLEAVYLPGEANQLADGISRDRLSFLFSQVSQVSRQPTQVPPALVSLLVTEQPDWTSPAWSQLFCSCFPPV